MVGHAEALGGDLLHVPPGARPAGRRRRARPGARAGGCRGSGTATLVGGDPLAQRALARSELVLGHRLRLLATAASSRRGQSVSSRPADTSSIGSASATVRKVAASRSSHWLRREAINQAASGRKTAVSSRRACGRTVAISAPVVISYCQARVPAVRPRPNVCVSSENAVTAITQAMATGPARSCTQREMPVFVSATRRIELPAMKPATQAVACRASTSRLRPRIGRASPASAPSCTPPKTRVVSAVVTSRDQPDGREQRAGDRQRTREPRAEDRRGSARQRSKAARVSRSPATSAKFSAPAAADRSGLTRPLSAGTGEPLSGKPDLGAADGPGARAGLRVEQRGAVVLLGLRGLRGQAGAADRGPGADVELVLAVVGAGGVDDRRVAAGLAGRDRVEGELGTPTDSGVPNSGFSSSLDPLLRLGLGDLAAQGGVLDDSSGARATPSATFRFGSTSRRSASS